MVAKLLMEWQSFQQRWKCYFARCAGANGNSGMLCFAFEARRRLGYSGGDNAQAVFHWFISRLQLLQHGFQLQWKGNGMRSFDTGSAHRCEEQVQARLTLLRRCRIAVVARDNALRWFMRLLQPLRHGLWQQEVDARTW
jgi:hypothetical protein